MSGEDLNDEVGEIVADETREVEQEVEDLDEQREVLDEQIKDLNDQTEVLDAPIEVLDDETEVLDAPIEVLDDQTEVLDEQIEVLDEQTEVLDEQIEALVEQEEQIPAIVVRDDDIIRLNVGGQKFTCKRSTLCQVECSLLAMMFSGLCEDTVECDQDGAAYFDFNPNHFALILDYLQSRESTNLENLATVVKFSDDEVRNFNILVENLGFSDEIVAAEIVPAEKFNLHSPGVTLEENGKVAVHDGIRGHDYVLGENTYQQGIVHLKLKLELFQNNDWIFIGILEGDVVPIDEYSYEWPGSYGWSLGSSGYEGIWKEGTGLAEYTLLNLTKQGDEIMLVLNCYAAKLSLHLPSGHQFHIDIPEDKAWRLNINMFLKNDKIRIL